MDMRMNSKPDITWSLVVDEQIFSWLILSREPEQRTTSMRYFWRTEDRKAQLNRYDKHTPHGDERTEITQVYIQ